MKFYYLKHYLLSFLNHRLVKIALVLILGFLLQVNISPVKAGGLSAVKSGMNTTASVAGLETKGDLPTIAGRVISQGLTIVGVLLVIYLLYGGFYWMTARGEEAKVKTAVGIIRNALTGIVIIALAFVVADWVVGSLSNATGADQTTQE